MRQSLIWTLWGVLSASLLTSGGTLGTPNRTLAAEDTATPRPVDVMRAPRGPELIEFGSRIGELTELLAGTEEEGTREALLYAFASIAVEPFHPSEIRLFNTGDRIVEYIAQVLDDQGVVVNSRSAAVLPGQVVDLDEPAPVHSHDRWIRIFASGPLGGHCLFDDEHGARAKLTLTSAAYGRRLVLPHISRRQIAATTELWQELSITNLGSRCEFRLIPRGSDGRSLANKLAETYKGQIPLEAGARFVVPYRELFAQGAAAVDELAWIEIHGEGALAAALLFGHRDGDFAALTALAPEQALREVPVLLGTEHGGYDGFHLFNPGAEASKIVLRARDDSGQLILEKPFLVEPSATLSGLLKADVLRIGEESFAAGRGRGPRTVFGNARVRRARTLSFEGTQPFLVLRVAGRGKHFLQASVPTETTERVALGVADADGTQRLHLFAADAGQALLRVHSPSGIETLRRDVALGPHALTTVELGPNDAGSYLSVVAADSTTRVSVVLEAVDTGATIAELPAIASYREPLPAGGDLDAPPDPNALSLSPVRHDWVQRHHDPLASLTSGNFDDLQFLKDLIADKRIVQLGESSHGTAEFSSAKVRLIQFLHQQMGFDVIAFESGVFEGEWTRRLDPREFNRFWHLYSSIFGVWHSFEALELFEYVRLSKLTPRPLILTGFDPQRSSLLGSTNRPAFIRNAIAPLDPDFAELLYQVDTELLETAWSPGYIQANRDRLWSIFTEALQFVEARRHLIEAARPEDPDIGKLMISIMRNQLTRIQLYWIYLVQQNLSQYTRVRDLAMADNLDYLADELYPGKKIITWAHNYHIRYDEPNVQNSSGLRSMGYHVGQRRREEVYTVGLFMYRGQAAFNDRTIYDVRPPGHPDSFEVIGNATGRKYSLIDMLGAEPEPGVDWIGQWLFNWSWGVFGPMRLVPINNYDALLFVDTTHPPSYTY